MRGAICVRNWERDEYSVYMYLSTKFALFLEYFDRTLQCAIAPAEIVIRIRLDNDVRHDPATVDQRTVSPDKDAI